MHFNKAVAAITGCWELVMPVLKERVYLCDIVLVPVPAFGLPQPRAALCSAWAIHLHQSWAWEFT